MIGSLHFSEGDNSQFAAFCPSHVAMYRSSSLGDTELNVTASLPCCQISNVTLHSRGRFAFQSLCCSLASVRIEHRLGEHAAPAKELNASFLPCSCNVQIREEIIKKKKQKYCKV